MAKKENLQKKSDKELHKELFEKRKALADFTFNIAGSKTTNVKEGRLLRRSIARILTALHNRSEVDRV